ncbi:Uncharacterised protein [Mannheimia haemolytica]|uniref:Uncharacterized protein n=1 Tax=Mannheimia haemolytica TaxID=75985 RepID=A0A378MW20_MANHA|nr:Uncharacterised protein [Mannheimia haemolytica]
MEKIARLFRNGGTKQCVYRLNLSLMQSKSMFLKRKWRYFIIIEIEKYEHWQRLFELLPAVVCDETFLDTKERNQSFEQRDPFEVA